MIEPPEDQPMMAAEEAAPPIVPPLGTHPPGFAPILHGSKKTWAIGTLTYTTGALCILFFWLLFGDFAFSIRERSVGPVVTLMLKKWEANNLTIAILLTMIPTAISMVLSPIISYKSDRMRSRWGRRIPFLLIPTPIAAVSMIGLAFAPHIADALEIATKHGISHKTALLTVFSVFWTCFEVAVVVSAAVFGGLINDVVPRAVMGRFYGMFRAVSLIDAMIFNWYIIGHTESHFTMIFIWIAIVFGVGFALMCLKVKEGDYPLPSAMPSDHRAGGFMAAVGTYFRDCFSRPHFVWIFAAFTLAALAAAPINNWSLLYAKSVNMNIDKWTPSGVGFGSYQLGFGGIATLTYFCSLTLAYPLGSMVDRFSALRVSIISMLLYAAVAGLGALFIHDAATFGWALLGHGVISGCYFTASASLGQVLYPRDKFAQFGSAGGIVTQVATLIWSPVLGAMLDWTGSNYRITFIWSFAFSAAAVVLLIVVQRRYQAMGGDAGYEQAIQQVTRGEIGPRGFDVLPVIPK